MPPAGAIYPPLILPLRQAIPGVPGNHIDTTTFIELETESPDCKIYFTTDGAKPNPFQLKVGGREITFKYRGPFTLKGGKRTIKTMAVTRDGFQESNIVTKTFVVDDAGVASECDDNNELVDSMFENESINSYRPPTTKSLVRTSTAKNKKNLRNTKKLKEAWATTTAEYVKPSVLSYEPPEHVGTSTNSVGIPDGCSPTNYSGTQINFWGCAPNLDPGKWAQQAQQANGQVPYGNTYPSQLGELTNKMINGLDGPKISLDELKTLYASQNQREYKDPSLNMVSEGCGDWKDQLRHIHAHLIEECKNNEEFRSVVGAPKMGKLMQADFNTDDNAYVITLAFTKPGIKPAKKPTPVAKPKPKVEPPPPPPPKAEPPKPKPSLKTATNVVKAVKKIEKPKPKPEPKKEPEPPKPEPKKHEDPYFVTEEYEKLKQKTRKQKQVLKSLKSQSKVEVFFF